MPNLNALLADLDPMERALRLDSLHRRSFASLIAIVLAGTMVIGFLPSILVGGIVSAVSYAVLRNQLVRELAPREPVR
jgi:hypothetical protein